MKKRYWIAVVVIIVVSTIPLYVLNAKLKVQENNVSQMELKQELIAKHQQMLIYNAAVNNEFKVDGSIVVTDITGKKILLKDLVSSKNKLIIRNSEVGCGLCIETEIKLIGEFIKKIGKENIICISTHGSARKLEVFKKMNNIDFDLYFYPNPMCSFEKTTSKPYLFTLNDDLKIQNFFLPDPLGPEFSKSYYNGIIDKYYSEVQN
jgi:hypothetical protein